ncbi:grasp-with-spasm system SPASM domain peptide maturase [Tenacibaculum maritimum]|uniref:grasp-with-spasm system SPASM domain peptide maturase n=1 Tax=Tenacibaculum maritimum TaxID=107401 RepID=UPI003875B0B8
MEEFNNKERLHLFSSIKMTKGIVKSVMIDLEQNDFHIVPNDLIDFIIKNKGKLKKEIFSSYPTKEHETIEEYLSFLLKENLIFFSELESIYFPDISDDWDSYSEISNSIIDIYSNKNTDKLDYIKSILTKLNCQNIEIRFFYKPTLNLLNRILTTFKDSIIRSISLTMPLIKDHVLLEELLVKYKRIMDINLYGEEKFEFETKSPIFFFRSKKPTMSCGVITGQGFAMNINSFTESRQFNSCLNRKLSINIETGYIKNCPSLPKTYGNIFKDDISTIISSKEFQKLWKVTKKEVSICDVCEFRDICTDCRGFTEMPLDGYKHGKPLKCGYDPYLGEWSNWEDNFQKISTFNKQCKTNII